MKKRLGMMAVAAMLAGCSLSEAPFIYTNPIVSAGKDRDTLHRTGLLSICYDDPDLSKARDLAAATCRSYGLQMSERMIQRNQCKVSAPHKLTVRCFDPKMRFANGAWVSVLDPLDVKNWRLEQAQLTGKPLTEIYAGPTMDIPDFADTVQRNDVDVPLDVK